MWRWMAEAEVEAWKVEEVEEMEIVRRQCSWPSLACPCTVLSS